MPFLLPLGFGLIQALLWAWLRPTYFILFFPAVILSALVGGFTAGLTTTFVSALAANYFFMPPALSFNFDGPTCVQLATFVFNCLVITGVTELLSRNHRQMVTSRFEEAIHGMRESYLSLDADGVVAYANERAEALRTPSNSTLVGKRIWDVYPQLKGTDLHKNVLSVLETKVPIFFEAQNLAKTRWLEHRIYPADKGVTLFSDDITQRVAARKALEKKTQEAIETNARLRWVNSELERSNCELEQFAHVASHDMKEPLRMIANYVRLLEEDYGSKLDENGKMFIDFAAKGALRLNALLNDILTHSQVQSSPMEYGRASMGDCVKEALDQLKTRVQETGAQVHFDSLPTIAYDQRGLVRVFQNLLGNALKFCHQGCAPEIRIGVAETPVEWIVSVTDNGIGVDPADQDRIFQLFKRGHSQDEYPGSGIGLATCKTIVERMGGSIWVESDAGKGATFRFTIPKDIKPNRTSVAPPMKQL